MAGEPARQIGERIRRIGDDEDHRFGRGGTILGMMSR